MIVDEKDIQFIFVLFLMADMLIGIQEESGTDLPACGSLGVHQQSAQPIVEVTENLRAQNFVHIHQSVGNVNSIRQRVPYG